MTYFKYLNTLFFSCTYIPGIKKKYKWYNIIGIIIIIVKDILSFIESKKASDISVYINSCIFELFKVKGLIIRYVISPKKK